MPSVAVFPSRRRVLVGLGALGTLGALGSGGVPGAIAASRPGSTRAAHAALLVIDMQDAFLPGGHLPEDGAAALLPRVRNLMGGFETVVLTQDWHSRDPEGARRPHAQVIGAGGAMTFLEPTDSAGAGLAAALLERGVTEVHVAGLPGGFLRAWPARDPDAARLGVRVIADACRGGAAVLA